MTDISFVIPSYNEVERIERTLTALRQLSLHAEMIVIDDGSTDGTKDVAKAYAQKVVVLPHNYGKGIALQEGWRVAEGTYVICLDADLEDSASEAVSLVEPLENNEADFVISIIKANKGAGFGFVKRRAQSIVFRETGIRIQAPLSGQRGFHRKWLPFLLDRPYHRFGVEMQMTIDLLSAGAKCIEIPTRMTHREMGKNVKGLIHRMKQWKDIERQSRDKQP